MTREVKLYRTIDCTFWDDPKIRRLGNPMTAYVLIYLFGNRHTHVSGIYYLARPTMLHETQLTARQLDSALNDLQSRGFISIDEDRNIVWVHQMLRRQCKKGICQQHITATVKQLDTLDGSNLVTAFLAHYQDLAIPHTIPHTIPHSMGHHDDTPSPYGDGDGDGDVSPPTPPVGVEREKRFLKTEAERIKPLTDKDEQLAEIAQSIPRLQADHKYRALDLGDEFESWKDWLASTGRFPVDYSASFRMSLRNSLRKRTALTEEPQNLELRKKEAEESAIAAKVRDLHLAKPPETPLTEDQERAIVERRAQLHSRRQISEDQ